MLKKLLPWLLALLLPAAALAQSQGGQTLQNVSILNPTNNQALCYQSSNNSWINGSCGGGGGSGITSLTGDVTATGPGASAATIAAGAVTNAKLANAAADTIKCNQTSSLAAVQDCVPLAVANLIAGVINVNYTAVANVATLSGVQTITQIGNGSSSVIVGTTVLLTQQTTASQNGIWLVNAGAWTRPPQFPSGYVIAAGCPCGVYTEDVGITLTLATTGVSQTPVTIDTTAQTWTTVSTLYGLSATTSSTPGFAAQVIGGVGGTASGAGGAANLTGGAAGLSGAGTAAGGAANVTGGAGSANATGTSAGGTANVTGGIGGGGSTGNGGQAIVTGGAGSATSTGTANGAAAFLNGGAGGPNATTSASGAGANVIGGNAGAASNSNGGNVNLRPGTAAGSGTNGVINLQDSTTAKQIIVAASGPQFLVTTVGALPSCVAGIAGTIRVVSDALTPAYGVALTGGSSTYALALCNGSAWLAH